MMVTTIEQTWAVSAEYRWMGDALFSEGLT